MVRPNEQQGSPADERRAPRAEAVFKPLALPALAAAVRAARPQPPRHSARELPPALRRDAETE